MKPLVIYDGACGLCVGNLKWLRRFDRLGIFRPIAYQDPTLKTYWPAADRKRCEEALHLVLPDGRIFRGAEAFREILMRIPMAFPFGLLMAIPPLPWILRTAYPLLARNRYFLGAHGTVSGLSARKEGR